MPRPSNRRVVSSLCAKHLAAFKATARRRSVRGVLTVGLGLAFVGLSSLGIHRASAANGSDTWLGNTSVNWADGANWNPATNAPPISGDSLIFGVAGTAGASLVNNLTTGSTFNLAGITFNSGASAFTITSGASNGFNLNTSNGIINNSSSLQTFSGAGTITLTQSQNTVNFVAGTGGLTINQGITYSGAAINLATTAGTLTLNGAGSGAGDTPGSGIYQLLGTNNTATSASLFVAVNGSNVVLGNKAALGTGAFVPNATVTLSSNTVLTGANAVGNLLTTGNGNNLTIGGTQNIEFSGTTTATGSGSAGAIINTGGSRTMYVTNTGTTTISGTVSLSENATTGYTLTMDVAGTAGTTTVSGVVQDYIGANGTGIGGVAGGFIKANTGTLTLSGANTYTGLTTVSAGTLKLGNSSALGGSITNSAVTTTSGTNTATVTSATGLAVGQAITGTGIPTGTIITAISGTTLTLSNNSTASGTVSATFAGYTTVASGSTLDLNGQTTSEQFGALGAVTGPVTGISGTGVGSLGALINSSGTAATVSGPIFQGANFTVGAGDITLNTVSRTTANGSQSFVVTKIGTGTLTLSGSVDNGGFGLIVSAGEVDFNKTGTARVITSGGVTINNGSIVKLTGTGTDQIQAANAVTVNNGTFNMNAKSEGAGTLTVGDGTNNGAVSGGSSSTYTLGASASTIELKSGSVDVKLAGFGAGVGSLNKTTSGTVTLSQSNTGYTGATTIGTAMASGTNITSATANGGTLQLTANGALGSGTTGTSGITINNGSTLLLSGATTTGTTPGGVFDRVVNNAPISLGTSGNTGVGGTIAISGTSPVLEGTATSTTNGSSTTTGTTTASTYASGSSVSVVGLGALTLTSNSTLDFGASTQGTLVFSSFADASNAFKLNIINYSSNTNGSTISGVDGTDDRLVFNTDMSAFIAAGDFTFNGSSMNITQIRLDGNFYEIVSTTPVPEPATVFGGLLLVGTVGYRQRRSLRGLIGSLRRKAA